MRTYVERVIDKKGNAFFIACGYHPYADREVAVELVRIRSWVKKQGLNRTAEMINDWASREFVYGRMALFIYDLDGTVIAEGSRPTVVGKNILKDHDESGTSYVQDLIDRAKKENTLWFSFRLRNATCSTYAETVEDNGKKYVLGATFFLFQKRAP